jgi:hypothetical protein
MSTATGIIVGLVLVGGVGAAIYFGSRSRPPITQVVQAPSAAVAGINALGTLAAKGFDSYLRYKAAEGQVSKSEGEDA